MKKVFAALMTTILFTACPMTTFAEESFDSTAQDSVAAVEETPEDGTFPTAGDLWIVWSKQSPDYLCGIWSTDGSYENITFGIQDTEEGNAGRQEILELVENDSTVSFVYQKHSRNYLLQIQDSLLPYFEKDIGLVSAGLNDYENRIDLEIYDKKAEDAATKEMIAELTESYGDALSIGYTDQLLDLTTGITGTPEIGIGISDRSQSGYLAAIGVMIVLAVLVAFVAVRRKWIPVLQTNTGTAVKAGDALTSNQVENLVKTANIPVTPELDRKVMDAIDRANSADSSHSDR